MSEEPRVPRAKKPTAKSRKGTEAIAATVENKLVRKLKAAAKSGELELDRAWMGVSLGSAEFDEKTNTATFAVRLFDLSRYHWKLDLETRKVTGVHLNLNRITEKENYDYGLMRHVPGTDIWVRTLPLSPTYCGAYSFSLLTDDDEAAGIPRQPGPPRHPRTDRAVVSGVSLSTNLDVDEEGRGTSLISGPLAPSQDHWHGRDRKLRGEVRTTYLEDSGLKIFAYLPTHLSKEEPDAQPCRLLTLFDAETWFFKHDLPRALENAMADGMEPVAVLGIVNHNNEHRLEQLKANAEFLEDVGTAGEDWIRQQAEDARIVLAPAANLIAGQSLGGLSALYAGIRHQERYSTIIAQSPSLWWSPEPGSTPRDSARPTHGWLTEQYYQAKAKALPQHVVIDVGVREGAMVNKAHMLAMALKARDIKHELHVHDGGHDWAWWRVALLEHLGAKPEAGRLES